jgi:hypothetical protein
MAEEFLDGAQVALDGVRFGGEPVPQGPGRPVATEQPGQYAPGHVRLRVPVPAGEQEALRRDVAQVPIAGPARATLTTDQLGAQFLAQRGMQRHVPHLVAAAGDPQQAALPVHIIGCTATISALPLSGVRREHDHEPVAIVGSAKGTFEPIVRRRPGCAARDRYRRELAGRFAPAVDPFGPFRPS